MTVTRHPYSGSSLARRKACPGSGAMEARLPAPPDSEDAAEGTMLHALMADKTLADAGKLKPAERIPWDHLTAEQVVTLNAVADMSAEWCNALRVKYGLGDQAPLDIVEQESWFHAGAGQKTFPIHPDRVLVWPRKLLAVFDYKFGRDEVPEAHENYQLRAYLATLAEEYDVDTYVGAIIQPRCHKKFHAVAYDFQDIIDARNEISLILEACQQPDAPRYPSPEACKYCRGLSSGECPEVRYAPAVLATRWNLLVPAIEKVRELVPADRSKLADMITLAKRVIENYEDAFKVMLAEDPESIPNRCLKPGRTLNPITDPLLVWQRCQELGIAPNEFIACVTIGKEKLEVALKEATSLKGKALKEKLDNVLAGATTSKQAAASLAER